MMCMTSSLIATALPLLVGVKAAVARVMWRYPLVLKWLFIVAHCAEDAQDVKSPWCLKYRTYLCSIHKNYQHQQSTFVGAQARGSNVSFFQCITRVESWNESYTRTTYQANLRTMPWWFKSELGSHHNSTLFEHLDDFSTGREQYSWYPCVKLDQMKFFEEYSITRG
jgi:hypothetical protein